MTPTPPSLAKLIEDLEKEIIQGIPAFPKHRKNIPCIIGFHKAHKLLKIAKGAMGLRESLEKVVDGAWNSEGEFEQAQEALSNFDSLLQE